MAHLKNNSESLYNHLMYWGMVQQTLCCKKEFYKGNRVKRKVMKKKNSGS